MCLTHATREVLLTVQIESQSGFRELGKDEQSLYIKGLKWTELRGRFPPETDAQQLLRPQQPLLFLTHTHTQQKQQVQIKHTLHVTLSTILC